MDFIKSVEELTLRSRNAERNALTEEATKTSFVLPFIQALGFDVFNLDEVIPEFVADVGTKKGEKVDFALKIDGRLEMLIEVKPISAKLGDVQYNQLFRYFSVTEARLAILTNGREAWFFSDTDAPNRMDKKPFFKFDFQAFDSNQLDELARFQKVNFNIDEIIEAASNLKYTRAAARYIQKQLSDPDEDFVRLVAKNIHEGSVTKSVAEQIRPAIGAALDEIVRERIQDKLSITFSNSSNKPTEVDQREEQAAEAAEGVETTEEELQAFMIVRAIGAKVSAVERINIRDAKSYCAVLMDDNNRKPVCRFYFNAATVKYVGIFDREKNETKHKVESTRDIYGFASQIQAVIEAYA